MKKPEQKLKLYQIQKFVMARSAEEALRLEKKILPDDVFINGDWQKEQLSKGFTVEGFKQ